MAGVKMTIVPYKSGSQETADLIGGHVQLTFGSAGQLTPTIKSGRLRALAVTTAQPSALFPGLPTMAASGLPGFDAGLVIGMFAPAKTPAAIIHRLNQETARLLNRPDVKQKFLDTGIEAVGNSPEEFAGTVSSDMARWGKLIKEAGIRAQ
jgi:tripartite-type tricarboxylate transporter receptor subunit TctC